MNIEEKCGSFALHYRVCAISWNKTTPLSKKKNKTSYYIHNIANDDNYDNNNNDSKNYHVTTIR